MQRCFAVLASALALALACKGSDKSPTGAGSAASGSAPSGEGKLELTSPAFAANSAIPAEYTCEGADRSPPLAWSGTPAAAKSLALIVDDPDAPDPAAPKQTWVHYVVSDIPPATTSLAAGATPDGALGTTDFGKQAWGGPCPPIGRHRYVFKLYALDTGFGKRSMTKAELEAAMAGHILARGELIGTYQKSKTEP